MFKRYFMKLYSDIPFNYFYNIFYITTCIINTRDIDILSNNGYNVNKYESGTNTSKYLYSLRCDENISYPITICKGEDEWYYLRLKSIKLSNKFIIEKHYKCDQLDGVLECLKDKL